MPVIESAANDKVVYAAKLKDKKYRRIFGRYIVEGEKLVRDALELNLPIEAVFTTESRGFLPDGESTFLVPPKVFSKISDTVSPQGVAAILPIPRETERDFKRCVILDGISDPGNLGTIVRTCAAVGVTDIFLVDCADPYSPKAVRSSMSGIYHVNFVTCTAESAVAVAEKRNLPIVIADMCGKNIFEVDIKDFALVVGSESHGVGKLFRDAANVVVSLKMKNIESLNAAVALGVILYKLTD